MPDDTGRHKTKKLGFLLASLSGSVRDCSVTLHSEGRGHRFESCRVRHNFNDLDCRPLARTE